MRPSFPLLLAFPLLTFAAFGCGIQTAPGGTGGVSSSGGVTGSGGSASGGTSPSSGGGSLGGNCSAGADCSLLAKTCCGVCGAPTASDMTAVMKGSEEAYRGSVCGGDIACPACASLPNPDLFAVCESGACAAADLSGRPEAKCAADTDCVVKPRACCECGAGSESWNLVALRGDSLSFLSENLCEPNYACDECAWVAPEGVSAACESGICTVKDSRPTPF